MFFFKSCGPDMNSDFVFCKQASFLQLDFPTEKVFTYQNVTRLSDSEVTS